MTAAAGTDGSWSIVCRAGLAPPGAAGRGARRAVAAALRESGECRSVSVLLADDRELQRLNGEHRGKDKPTNVLSFPGVGDHLGDIAAGARRGAAGGPAAGQAAGRAISRTWSRTARCT